MKNRVGQAKEYKARDKTVNKMSRDGLTEENLGSGESKRVSRKETDGKTAEATEGKRADVFGDEEEKMADAPERASGHSSRSGNIRGHPSNARNYAKTAADASSIRQRKQEEDNGKTKKADLMRKAEFAASAYVHEKGQEAEDDNSALEAADKAELMAESALRRTSERSKRGMQYRLSRRELSGEEAASRLQFESARKAEESARTAVGAAEAEKAKKNAIKHFWQKQRQKKMYQSAKDSEQTAKQAARTAQTFLEKTKSIATSFVKSHKGVLGVAVALIVLIVAVSSGVSSCAAVLQASTATVVGTTYVSTDEEIYAVEEAYSRMEDALNDQINSMESRHPGYDEYRYQVDEIVHNPYHLISYFTSLYGGFTYEQVKDELKEIFKEQYGLDTESTRGIVTERKTVRVGESLGEVVTSGYCNCSLCCGRWAGGPTASGKYPTANHTIAVDASHPFVPMGTKVVMNGVEYTVEDTGAFARYGVQFDVYYSSHSAASAHGHKRWEAYIADDNGQNEVEVTVTRNVNRFDTTLTNHSLDAVLRSRMGEDEEKRYDIYNTTFGNRNYLFDIDSLPTYGSGGFGYQIPAEALTDVKFAKMIREAEKYLGYPYRWGGSSPSTSFDCSGFVSWVINHCGNGWNVGRQTANGLRSRCAYVPPSQAKPGDLIFFQGTYKTSGASHVGIYVGNNRMIHCGNPIQYTTLNSSYWKKHFLAFGRLP